MRTGDPALASARYRARFCTFGVWCNASIRVLGTRGDSSILFSPTNRIADCQLPTADWPPADLATLPERSNRQSAITNRQCPPLL